MDKQTEVALKQIELINQEIIKLSARVAALESQILKQQTKIKPLTTNPSVSRIIKEADNAMERLGNRR